MLIRIATQDDVNTIADMNVAMALETEGKALASETIRRGVMGAMRRDAGHYFLAYEASDTLGALMITKEWSDWRNAFFWWIQSVYVLPAHRRRGVYAALHRHVRELAAKEDDVCGLRLYVERENVGAQKTYAAMGMTASSYVFFEETLEPES